MHRTAKAAQKPNVNVTYIGVGTIAPSLCFAVYPLQGTWATQIIIYVGWAVGYKEKTKGLVLPF